MEAFTSYTSQYQSHISQQVLMVKNILTPNTFSPSSLHPPSTLTSGLQTRCRPCPTTAIVKKKFAPYPLASPSSSPTTDLNSPLLPSPLISLWLFQKHLHSNLLYRSTWWPQVDARRWCRMTWRCKRGTRWTMTWQHRFEFEEGKGGTTTYSKIGYISRIAILEYNFLYCGIK